MVLVSKHETQDLSISFQLILNFLLQFVGLAQPKITFVMHSSPFTFLYRRC
jgi:hypothetical protein